MPRRVGARQERTDGGLRYEMALPPPGAPPAALPPIAVLARPPKVSENVSLQQPVLLTTFSYDANKMLCFDDRSKRWYKTPPTQQNSVQGANLNYGVDTFRSKPHIPDPLDSLLFAVMQRAQAGDAPVEAVRGAPRVPADQLDFEMLRAQVITWRGIMTKLCTAWSCHVQAPPMFREGFELNAMMLGDTLVLEEAPPSLQQQHAMMHQPPPSKRSQASTYYGYSFESYCTQDHPGYTQTRGAGRAGAPPGWGGDVNTNVQWCHIVKTKLGPHRLVLGGEVDCVETVHALTEREHEVVVELKTNMVVQNDADQLRLDAKMLKMYMQSFLLGVQKIVVGFRDARGTLEAHATHRTADLPRLVRGRPGQWNAADNMAFGAAVLEFARTHIHAEMERWLHAVALRVRANEQTRGAYAWRVHRTTQSFLGQLPLPAACDAEQEYPVFRLSFQPPFTHVSLRYVHPYELQCDGRRERRCGLVPTPFYEWATRPMQDYAPA